MFYRLKIETDREVHTQLFLPIVEIKDYNVMIDGRNDLKTFEKLELVKLMIIQLVANYIIHTSKNIIS